MKILCLYNNDCALELGWGILRQKNNCFRDMLLSEELVA